MRSFAALTVLVLSLALVAACGGATTTSAPIGAPASNTEPAAEETPPDPMRLSDAADLRDGVGTFTSIPWGFDTNSFWIEGPESVIVLDTQFLPSEAEHLIAVIEARTKKKVTTALVLHPNPDKFNGADVFRAHGAKVVTSSAVQRQIPAVAEKRRHAFQARYAPDYPERDPGFDKTFEYSMKLQDGGVELDLHVLGRGCSEAHVVATWKGHLFAGDLVANGTHAWLELGYVREWLQRIDDMEGMKPLRVHPGRGASGGRELLAQQRKYLERVRDLVDEARPTVPAPPGAVDAIKAKLVAEYPALEYDVFLKGLGAVWRNEAAHLAESP
jgi:glyoxylase-like metal-dependent hydrolase (beta-lactamase superfamily II)